MSWQIYKKGRHEFYTGKHTSQHFGFYREVFSSLWILIEQIKYGKQRDGSVFDIFGILPAYEIANDFDTKYFPTVFPYKMLNVK